MGNLMDDLPASREEWVMWYFLHALWAWYQGESFISFNYLRCASNIAKGDYP